MATEHSVSKQSQKAAPFPSFQQLKSYGRPFLGSRESFTSLETVILSKNIQFDANPADWTNCFRVCYARDLRP